ncbi:unnamed protein product [Caenorhabditis nigoni]
MSRNMTIYRRKKEVFSVSYSSSFILNRFGDVENLRKTEINIFILLLKIPEQNRYFIELRSLKNLLKSINHEIPQHCFLEIEKVRIFSSHHFLALYSPSKILVLDIENLEKFQIFEFPEIISLIVLNGNLCFINSSGIVFNLEKNEKSPSHQLCFGSSEYTVDVACDETNLYSLTAAGVVSVWKLRPNGRKYRDQLFTTYLNHCSKLLYTHPQKFVILTTTEVHFVVFGTDTTDSGPQ